MPDGTLLQGVPDGTTKAQLSAKLRANGMNVPDEAPQPKPMYVPGLSTEDTQASQSRISSGPSADLPPIVDIPQQPSLMSRAGDAISGGYDSVSKALSSGQGKPMSEADFDLGDSPSGATPSASDVTQQSGFSLSKLPLYEAGLAAKGMQVSKDAADSLAASIQHPLFESGTGFYKLLGAAPVLYDKAVSATTGKPTTAAEDFWFRKTVDPMVEAAQKTQVSPDAPIDQQLIHTVGNTLGVIGEIIGTSGGAEIPKLIDAGASAFEAIKTLLSHGVKSMAAPAVSDMLQTGADVWEKTEDPVVTARSMQAQYLNSTLGGIMPLGMPGGLIKKLASGSMSGFATGEFGRQTMNLALPEGMQTQFTMRGAEMNAATGAVLSGVMGPNERHLDNGEFASAQMPKPVDLSGASDLPPAGPALPPPPGGANPVPREPVAQPKAPVSGEPVPAAPEKSASEGTASVPAAPAEPVVINRAALKDAFQDETGAMATAAATHATTRQVEEALKNGIDVAQSNRAGSTAITSADQIDMAALLAGKSRIEIGKKAETPAPPAAEPASEPGVDLAKAAKAAAAKGPSIAATKDGYAVTLDGKKQAEYGDLERAKQEKAALQAALDEKQAAIDAGAHEAATSPQNELALPSHAQKEAENYKVGAPVTLFGKTVRVENPAGSHRTNFDAEKIRTALIPAESPKVKTLLLNAEGKYRLGDVAGAVQDLHAAAKKSLRKETREYANSVWANQMPAHYGRILGTEAKDGDHRDVFIGPRAADESLPAYVVDINKPGTKTYDESKSMVGFGSQEEALQAFHDSYPKDFAAGITRGVTKMEPTAFRAWLHDDEVAHRPAGEDKSASSQEQKQEASTSAAPAPRNVEGVWRHEKHGDATATVEKIDKGYSVDFGGGDKQEFRGPTAQSKVAATLAKEGFTSNEAPSPEQPTKQKSSNKIFTDDAADKARATLRAKLSQLRSGIDPEMVHAGITLAGYHIEKGARTFAEYSKAMVGDLGEKVRPYLKSWFYAIKHDPRMEHVAHEMTEGEAPAPKAVEAAKPAEAVTESDPEKRAIGSFLKALRGDGSIDQGLLMPRAFKLEDAARDQPVQLSDAQTIKFLANAPHGIVRTSDGKVQIVTMGGDYLIKVPKSKAEGGQYYLHPALRAAVGGDFTSIQDTMRARVNRDQLLGVVNILNRDFGQALYVDTNKDVARAVGGKSQIEQAAASQIKTMLRDDKSPPVGRDEFLANHSLEGVKAHVADIAKRWVGADLTITVHDNLDTVPASARNELNARGDLHGDMLGFIDGKNIHLIRDHMGSMEELEKTLFHEVEGHLSVRQFFGDKALPFLQRVAMADPKGVRAVGIEFGFFDQNGKPTAKANFDTRRARLSAADEYVARMAETINSNSPPRLKNLWDYLVSHFNDMLRWAGWKSYKPSASEIRGWLIRSQQALHRKKRGAAPQVQTAEEGIATQLRTVKSQTPPKAAAPQAWNVADDNWRDRWLYDWQNEHIDTDRVVQQIEKLKQAQLADAQDPSLGINLYPQRTAYRVEKFMSNEFKPLLDRAHQLKIKPEELEEYLLARHAEDRNGVIAARNPGNPDLQDGGSGVYTADAQAFLASIPTDRISKLDELAQRVDKMIEETRQTAVGYGLESQNTVNMWRAAFGPHYVPLQRADFENDSGVGVGQGFSVRGSISKSALGSHKEVKNILAQVAMQREKVITRGEKNRVALALYGLAKSEPNTDWWSIDRVPQIRHLDNSGIASSRPDFQWKTRPNVITVRIPNRRGRVIEHGIVFNESNPRAVRMAAALKNLDAADLETYTKFAGYITRYVAKINTQYSPTFGIMNFKRDIQDALLNANSLGIGGNKAKLVAYSLNAIDAIFKDAYAIHQGRQPTSRMALQFEEMRAAGGGSGGYADIFKTPVNRAKEIQDEYDRLGFDKLKVPKEALAMLESYNMVMENAVRFAAYRIAKEKGMSNARAAQISNESTVNFRRKGRLSRKFNNYYAFFNAVIQSGARWYKTLASPGGKAIIATGLSIGAAQALVLSLAGFGDNEPPEFIKRDNLVIPTGKGKYVLWDLPQGARWLVSMGRIPAEAALRKGKTATDAAFNMLGDTLTSFNPLGASTIAQTVAPTIADPAVALWENKTFSGNSIYKEKIDPNDPTPGFTRTKDTASSFSKMTSHVMNELSGGDDYTAGNFSPTPDQIDYLLGQATGGIGRELSKADQVINAKRTGEELPSYKIPLIGRLYGNINERASQREDFYNLVRQGRIHEEELNGRAIRRFGESDGERQDRIREYEAQHPDYRISIDAVKAAREISEARANKRRLAATGNATQAQLNGIDDNVAGIISKLVAREKSQQAQHP